jgi:hypothetical protein
MRLVWIAAAMICAFACDDGDDADTGPPVSWTAEVEPILDMHCTRCHPEYEACTSVAPAPIAADVLETSEDGSMPPDGEDRVPAADIETLRRWIAQGRPCD